MHPTTPILCLGPRLRVERVRQQIKQKDLAQQVGLTPSTLAAIEHGRQAPHVTHLRALAEALQISSDYLLGLTDTPAR
jgi:transcriptional regulator with XRE-family HTH domain